MVWSPAPKADLLEQPMGNEAVVWSPIRRRPAYLDPLARLLLTIFDGRSTTAEIIDDIEEEFSLDREVATNQVMRLLLVLDSAGALESSIPEDSPNDPNHLVLDSGIQVQPFPDPPNW